MKDSKECKIIQDLLPNYIENLTNEETSKFVKEHINKCDECSQIYKTMKFDLENNNKTEKKEINFIKKYNQKYNLLKLILTIIIIFILVVITRKEIIIKSISDKATKSVQLQNYYSKRYEYGIDTIGIVDEYRKDGKYLKEKKIISKETGEKLEDPIIEVFDGEKYILYTTTLMKENDGVETKIKTAQIVNDENVKVSDFAIIPGIKNYINSYSLQSSQLSFHRRFIPIFKDAFGKIDSTKCNGKECYVFSNMSGQVNHDGHKMYAYIDKETGLPVRITGGWIGTNSPTEQREYNEIIDFYIEFNKVTDEDLLVPDIDKYKLVE